MLAITRWNTNYRKVNQFENPLKMDGDNSNNIDLVMTIDENGDNGESKDQHQRDTEKYHKHLNFSNFQLPGWE